ncbi:MAG: GH92 family glycosyl hydrolase, partial [Propionibacterium sp.]|nr:GH92 family glycosyl hydrolase [Propionibacterium sp.]
MRIALPRLTAFAATAVLTVGGLVGAPGARAATLSPPVDAVSAVDPFIGTEETVSINQGNARGNAAYGNTVPGATVPFGMVQNSPATFATTPVNSDIGNTRGGYEYNADTIRGFGLTRLSGTGCSGRFGGFDVPILPFTGALDTAGGVGGATLPTNPSTDISRYHLPFSHDRESAEPGYYSVTTDNGVTTELTASTRTAVDRFTFPSGDPGSDTLVIDAAGSNNDVSASDLVIDPETRTVSGSVTAKIVCATGPSYTAYFSATFDQPFESFGIWSEASMTAGGTSASSTTRRHGAGAWLSFADGAEVTARIGLSYVSVEGAAGNVSAETATWDFDTVRSTARQSWAEALGTVDTRGGSAEADTKFYTALYHALGNPNVFEDADGRYTGYDDQVHRVRDGHHFYVNFSGWDTYRGQAQLVALLEPQVASDINQSIVDMVDQSGKWSSWPSYNRVQTKMSGDSLQVIVAATDAFGATDYDRERALTSMVETQAAPRAATASNRSDAFLYTTLGWVSGDSKNAATSRTLEYATDDFAIAQLARRLGDADAQALFSQRSQNWMNIFNPVRRHIDARNKNGFMNVALNTQGDQFEQSTGKQYGFSVPFNMAALIEARGGIARATADLDSMLEQLDAGAFSEYAYMTNQPSFGLPWVHNWLRSPASTTDTLDRVVAELFGSGPDGLLGNDDLGSLSSWYVWANLGLFPGIYGTADLLVSSPMFEQVTIRSAASDRVIAISAPGATQGARHIEGLSVDGVGRTASWLPETFARDGGTLQFTITSSHTSSWGTGEDDVPPSYPEGTDDPNGRGVTHDGARDAGSLDAAGATLSYEKLASQGVTPGAPLPFGDTGVTFTWPGSADGAHPDHYIPHGQRLDVANVSTTGISFLGLATNGPSTGNASVVYTDGSTHTVTVSLSDWTPSTVPAGNTALVELQGRNTREGGSDTARPKLFATDVAGLDPSKTVDAVILPTTVDKGVMHIFAVGFRNPEAAGAEATRTSLSLSPTTVEEGHNAVASVTVSPGGVAGTVTLSEEATALGSSAVAGDGTARIEVPGTLAAGSHTLIATFSPDDTGAHLPSTSPGVVLTVLPLHTSDARGARWTRTYESGTPAPAGFPQRGEATGIRGESVLRPGQIAEVTSNAPNTGNIKEYVARLADGDRSTKWYASGSRAPSGTSPVIAAYALTGAQAVTGYSVTAAADSSSFPERDPRSWQILASDAPGATDDLNGSSWEVVATEIDQTFAANGLTRFYRITDPHPHSAYQLRVTANAGGVTKNATTQIADWTLSTDDGDSPQALGVSVRQTGTAPGGAGVQALRYAGRILGDGPVDSSTVLQMDLDITVTEGTSLSYLLRPDNDASAPVSVDVVYSAPGSQQRSTLSGEPVSATPGKWTPVTVDLSSLVGAHVHELQLHHREGSGVADTLVSGWIDSLTIGSPLVDGDTVWTYLDL